MAKYKATPFYTVHLGNKRIKFGRDGIYETELKGEIGALDALCPRYLTCIEKDKPTPKKSAKKAEAEPKKETPKTKKKAKPSAKK